MTAPGIAGKGGEPDQSRARRFARWLYPRPRAQLWLLLAAPLLWIGIVYLGSLLILLLNAFWAKDAFTGKVAPFDWTLKAFGDILTKPVYANVAGRTALIAVLVTITDAVLAFPIAYYMARIASPRRKGALVVAVLLPLWAAYLV
jgi:putative spermidine/putrescine transport system permease protein